MGVGEAALALGATVLGYHSSGLPGPKGNLETFIWLAEAGRASGQSAGRSDALTVTAGGVSAEGHSGEGSP